LTLSEPDQYDTPLDLSQMLINAFYDAMWNSDEYNNNLFLIKTVHGPQKAVGFTEINVDGSCTSYVPLASPTVNGNSMFVFNAHAVDTFRRDILAPFLANFDPYIPADATVLFEAMDELSDKQNAYTVAHLAGTLPYYLVTIHTPQ